MVHKVSKYIKGAYHVAVDVINRLDYDKKSNTHTFNAHIRNMSFVELFNGYVNKTINSKAFQLGDYLLYVHGPFGIFAC